MKTILADKLDSYMENLIVVNQSYLIKEEIKKSQLSFIDNVTAIKIEDCLNYNIPRNNIDGFIVTTWSDLL